MSHGTDKAQQIREISGANPLIGRNLEKFGPRFPDVSDLYTASLREAIKSRAAAAEIPLDYKAFCDLYSEANANVVSSSTQNIPSEDTEEVNEVSSEEPEVSAETDTANVDNEPVRRRKRRTE